jgi:hypothetical protein
MASRITAWTRMPLLSAWGATELSLCWFYSQSMPLESGIREGLQKVFFTFMVLGCVNKN